MYCPNCAAPIEGAKFCRSCGANVSLVPQALSGQLSMPEPEGRRGRRHGPPSIEKAATNFFTGIGFIVAALAVMFYFPAGWSWGWSFFFPAFACLGKGVGQYLQLKQQAQASLPPAYSTPPAMYAVPPAQPAPRLPVAPTSSMPGASSVTEQTTRHLSGGGDRKE